MRLIDADALKTAFEELYPLSLDPTEITFVANKCIYETIDSAPTVDIPNYGGQVVPDTLHGWRYEARSYRKETCDRKYGCYDYEHWHCIGCNLCKKGEQNENN